MTSSASYTSLVVTSQEGTIDLYDYETTGELSSMHPEMVLEFWRAGIVRNVAIDKDELPLFDMQTVRRLRFLEDLRAHQDVKLRTLRLIVNLIDRVDSTENELRRLRERLL